MNAQRADERVIAQQAADWLMTLESGSAEDRAKFSEWILKSPAHIREFLNLTAVDRMFDGVKTSMDISALLTTRAASIVAPLREDLALSGPVPAPRGIHRPRTALYTGIAAGLTAIALLLTWTIISAGWQSYETQVAEQRSIELNDGSTLYLSAGSLARVHYSDGAREIHLEKGEALFTVKSDVRRPFRVLADKTAIEALGTQFNVNRRTHDTTVAVIEGAVRVDGKVLAAGEAAKIDGVGDVIKQPVSSIQQIAAWRERRLVFQSDTLEDVATEFNRYNRNLRIRIEGAEVRSRRFTGVLDARRPESLLELLEAADDLVAEKRGQELVVKER